MRLLPGGPRQYNKESISGKMLMEFGLKNPDFIPTIMRMPELKSPFIKILDMKGLKTKGLNYGSTFMNGNYRAVGSNVIEYRIESTDMRKEHFKANPDGVTFIDDANPTQPGKGVNAFYVYLDSDYIGYKEVFILADNDTQLYCVSEGGKEQSNGSYEYEVKLRTNNIDDYVDPTLLSDSYEVMLGQTLHEHDFSERANEVRMQMASIGRAFLSLQRVKYSYSGTAQAMDRNGNNNGLYQVMHVSGGKAQSTYLSMAEMQMLKDAAKFTEFQIMEGKSTVSVLDYSKVLLHDSNGREIMSGDGIMHANDGPIEFPMSNGWTKGFMDSLLTEIDPFITTGTDGKREAYVSMAPKAYLSFTRMMADLGVTQNQNIVGDGASKGIVDTYGFYELAGIRLIAERNEMFSQRPGIPLKDGSKTNEWDQYIVPLGLTAGGRNGVELVQLRPTVNGTVAGINEGGEVASSVDGTHKHMLWQMGVISQIQPVKIFRPYKNNTI
jgi:hypothetical protein